MRKLIVCLIVCLSGIYEQAAGQVNIIPAPALAIPQKGYFTLNRQTTIQVGKNNPDLLWMATAFAHEFKINILRSSTSKPNIIRLRLGDTAVKNKEGYNLKVNTGHIDISASTPAGIFYGLESLRQLMPVKTVNGVIKIPAVDIHDQPLYPYRAMELDVSRHFFPVPFIKKYLDILAAYKINTFHWHLTDSHGWRLEIKKYPRLTSVGAWRADRSGIPMTIAEPTGKNEAATYGGFYTQEQVKDVIRYASVRNITIIPEIEMPGHCTAALVAYPEYSDLDNPVPLLIPCGYPGDLKHNFCVSYEPTYTFLENILTEVMALFPSQYIHIGGDEVKGDPWLACSPCQKLMKDKGFKDAKELQAYFTARIDSFINAHGKKAIGWEEILSDKVAPGTAGMVWHEKSGALKAVKNGFDVVMTPYRYTYFDFYQSDPRLEQYITYAPLFLDSVYAFDPIPAGIAPADIKHILGGQACLWTENVETPERVEYMTLPRLLALSEDLWTPPNKKNYDDFINRLEVQNKKLDANGITYAKSMYNIGIHPVFDTTEHAVNIVLSKQTGSKYTIRYTTDGTAPGINSPVYQKNLSISKSIILTSVLTDQHKVLGLMNRDTFNFNLATGAKLSVLPLTTDTDALHAQNMLVDGIKGTVEPYDGRWVAFNDSTNQVIIDLGSLKKINAVSLRCMEDQVSLIYRPAKLTYSVSADGKAYQVVYTISNPDKPESLLRHNINYDKTGIGETARYVKISMQHPGKPVFIDEISIN